jgi:hypothetical protein
MASKYLCVADNGELAGEDDFFGVIMTLEVAVVAAFSVDVSAKLGCLFLSQTKYEAASNKTTPAPM